MISDDMTAFLSSFITLEYHLTFGMSEVAVTGTYWLLSKLTH